MLIGFRSFCFFSFLFFFFALFFCVVSIVSGVDMKKKKNTGWLIGEQSWYIAN